MINTVVRNLINNAVKFTSSNGTIEVSIEQKNGFQEVHIQDDGIGISKDDIDKLFRIDKKFKSMGTDGEKGTGLGLILCKEFVEKNRGKISVNSEKGKGSTFVFTIPQKPMDL